VSRFEVSEGGKLKYRFTRYRYLPPGHKHKKRSKKGRSRFGCCRRVKEGRLGRQGGPGQGRSGPSRWCGAAMSPLRVREICKTDRSQPCWAVWC